MLCTNESCFGCSACHDICPTGAITMSIETGFFRPEINKDTCINCGMCYKVCGKFNDKETKKNYNKNRHCYASFSKNECIHSFAASGGVATEISKQFILSGGIVIGAVYDSNRQCVHHVITENILDLKKLAKSKYVYSDCSGIYKKIASKLKEKKCLFIGTPCQVNAMKLRYTLMQGKKNELYTIDLLCRGGASPKVFSDHLRYVSDKKKVLDITFRGQPYDCMLTVYGEKNKIIYQGRQFEDVYYKLFMRHTLYQESCFSCPFAKIDRVGDITLGDFWGVDETVVKLNKIQGINMVMVNNEKGEILFNSIKGEVVRFTRPLTEAVTANSTLDKPTSKEAEYEKLWDNIGEIGFFKAVENVYGINIRCAYYKQCIYFYLRNVKKTIKKYLPNTMAKFYKQR